MSYVIRSQSKGPYNRKRLFHSIDFTPNSKDIWISGMRGAGGPALIFTFYKKLQGEARKMIQGLGVFLSHIYGAQGVYKTFSESHRKASKGWSWDEVKKKFDTPDARQMKENVWNDANREMMDIIEKEMELELEEAEKKAKDKLVKKDIEEMALIEIIELDKEQDKGEESEQEDPREQDHTNSGERGEQERNVQYEGGASEHKEESSMQEAKDQREKELIDGMEDDNLVSQGGADGVRDIDVAIDGVSIDSSITHAATNVTDNSRSAGTKEGNSVSSFSTIEENYICNLVDPELSLNENKGKAVKVMN